MSESEAIGGCSISRSNIADPEEWIEEGDDGLERWWPRVDWTGTAEGGVAMAEPEVRGNGCSKGEVCSEDGDLLDCGTRIGDASRDERGERARWGVRAPVRRGTETGDGSRGSAEGGGGGRSTGAEKKLAELCLRAEIVLTKVCAGRYEGHLSGEGLGGVQWLETRWAGGLSGGRKQDRQQAGTGVRGGEYT